MTATRVKTVMSSPQLWLKSNNAWIFFNFCSSDLGSEEESGKDWSDLEREAAEEDKNYGNKEDFSVNPKSSKKPSHDRDRHHRDKHKSTKR